MALHRAKKFIAIVNYLLQTFTSKTHNNLQGVFPTMIGFVIPPRPTFLHDLLYKQNVAKGYKVNKTPCKLLCAFEVKVCNK